MTPEQQTHATLDALAKRVHGTPKAARGAHWQMAKRRVTDARMFVTRNPDHCARLVGEAQQLLATVDALAEVRT
jgi:hypothetical protein